MKKRLQVILDDTAWAEVNKVTEMATQGFENGSITFSDVINEMVICSNVNLEKLQLKHTNVRKSLRVLASKKDLDIDSAIETLMALKKGTSPKKRKPKTEQEIAECLVQ